MAALTRKAVKIDVIAEEVNDVDVLYEFTCKIIKENNFSFLKFVGHGCGKLRRKCGVWARNLIERGCSYVVVVHDLDNRDEKQLRKTLEAEIDDVNLDCTVILIPIEEIESWLLSDPGALKTVFNMHKLPLVPKSPEKVSSPKKILGKLVRANSKAQYLNTVHNRRIASKISIRKLRRCPSFSDYPKFLTDVFPKASTRVS